MDKNKNFNESSLNLSEAGSLKLDLADNKLFCDMMMLRMQRGETVDGRLGLDILERCWGRLRKANARGNVISHILRMVSSPEDVERLKAWRTRMSGMGANIEQLKVSNVTNHSRPLMIELRMTFVSLN